MSEVLWVIIALVIGIILAIILLVIVLRNKGATSGQMCSAAAGQCAANHYCNADGFCVTGNGAGAGQACAVNSECIYGLACVSGTCQNPFASLIIPANSTQNGTSNLVTLRKNLNKQTPTLPKKSEPNTQFLTTAPGKLSVISNNQIYLTEPIPDLKVDELKNFIRNGNKPSYISNANSFSGQSIYINTSTGKYYLQINSEGSYWIHEQFMNNTTNVKFNYDKEQKSLSTNSKKISFLDGGHSSQIKFSLGKYYLQTDLNTENSEFIIERNSSGYYIRTINGMYLTADLSKTNVTYAKFPAILAPLKQLKKSVELIYLQIGVYLKK